MAAPDHSVSLSEKFGLVAEHWSPKVVGEFNDVLVKVEGEGRIRLAQA
jgi:hypothetical protein